MSSLPRLLRWLTPLLELDLRALALFRVGFGVLCVVDFATRLPYLELMYANTGWLPSVDALAKLPPNGPSPLTLLHAFQSEGALLAFFWVAILCASALIVGFKTRLAHTLTVICLLSLHNRHQTFQNGGDLAANLWALWTLWLPLGERWSIDSLVRRWRREDPSDAALCSPPSVPTAPYLTLASLGVLLNLAACYFFNAVHKTGKTWKTFDAVAYTLEQDRILYTLGEWVRQGLPNWALQGLAVGTLVIEAGAVIMLLSPWKTLWLRRAFFVLLGGFHVGLICTVQLGLFAYWMLVVYLLLLRREDLDALTRLVRPRAGKIVMFYDSDCGVCHATARLASRLDGYALVEWRGRFSAAEVPAALLGEGGDRAPFEALRDETLIAWDPATGRTFTHHEAVAELARRLPLLAPLGWLLRLTAPLSRRAYAAFAARRHLVSAWLGYGLCGMTAHAVGDQVPPEPQGGGLSRAWRSVTRGVGELYIAVFMVVFFYATLHHNRFCEPIRRHFPVPSWVSAWVRYADARQAWSLFAPDAPTRDGWMVLVAKLADGTELDARTGLAPDWSVAHHSRRTWNFYLARIDFKLLNDKSLWDPFVRWMRRPTHRMALAPEDQVVELKYYWVGDTTARPRARRVDPPVGPKVELKYSWSLAEERRALREAR
jgi:predicted DCC family thiol-disulfide oxidoreductase YuxK